MSRKRLPEGGIRLLLGHSGEHTPGRLLGDSDADQYMKRHINLLIRTLLTRPLTAVLIIFAAMLSSYNSDNWLLRGRVDSKRDGSESVI